MTDALTSGLGLTRAQNVLDVLDDLVPVASMEPVGEIRIVTDRDTCMRLPWHLHFSLWDVGGTVNLMPDPADPFALSEQARAFLAGCSTTCLRSSP